MTKKTKYKKHDPENEECTCNQCYNDGKCEY